MREVKISTAKIICSGLPRQVVLTDDGVDKGVTGGGRRIGDKVIDGPEPGSTSSVPCLLLPWSGGWNGLFSVERRPEILGTDIR